MPPSKIQADVRERIRLLYPGDQFKSLRNKLYSTPGFLDSNPTDAMIREEAGEIPIIKEDKVLPPTSELSPLDQVVKIKQETLQLMSAKPLIAVKTSEDYIKASEIFAFYKKIIKDLDAKYDAIVDPLNKSLKVIRQEFKDAKKDPEEKLEAIEKAMKEFKLAELAEIRKQEDEKNRLIQEAKDKAQREIDAAKAKLEEAHQAEESAEDPFLAALLAEDVARAQSETKQALVSLATACKTVETPNAIVPLVAPGSKSGVVWKWEITNDELVARAYCSPDTKKINALVKMLKEAYNGDISKVNQDAYPGLVITEDIQIGAR